MPVLKIFNPNTQKWEASTGPTTQLTDAPGATVRRTTQQSAGTSTDTPISFDAEDYDSHGFWNSGAPTRFTVPAGHTGRYQLSASTHTSPSTVNPLVQELMFRVNGGTRYAAVRTSAANNTYGTALATSVDLTLAAGDYVECLVWQNSGGILNFGWGTLPYQTQFSIVRLASGTPGPQGPAGTVSATSGIVFPATQEPSTLPNVLDDYEENDWTPVMKLGTTTVTCAINGAAYTKVGRVVFFTLALQVTNLNGGSGNLTVEGLPFAARTMNCPGGLHSTWHANFGITPSLWAGVLQGATNMVFYKGDNTPVTQADMSGDEWLQGLGFYFAAA